MIYYFLLQERGFLFGTRVFSLGKMKKSMKKVGGVRPLAI